MFRVSNITIKNFMSVGAITQAIDFNEEELILVLGQNMDQGGNDSRNGVGKSTIINAVSYALFGEAIVKIKKDNLINKINKKNMMVTMDFTMNGVPYRIERGRKPNVFRFYEIGKDDLDQDSEDNDSQGENKDTQQYIESIIGLSSTMFKQIVGLNTFNQPFLSMSAGEQRNIIEQLLGITKLSEKADVLKSQIKVTKDQIKEEEYRIKSVEQSNATIQSHINSMKTKSAAWERSSKDKLDSLAIQYDDLSTIDIKAEIDAHMHNSEVTDRSRDVKSLESELRHMKTSLSSLNRSQDKTIKKIEELSHSESCPTCGSSMGDDIREQLLQDNASDLEKVMGEISELTLAINEINDAIESIGDVGELLPTKYRDINEAKDHESKLSRIVESMESQMSMENPYTEQIEELSGEGIQEIDYTTMNELIEYREHQDYLLKLLTNKDSFIRKKIIEQNLSFLNNRLSEYIDKMGLPHTVKFQSDLTVDIDKHGQSFDFDNLSRGEKTRLVLSLSWSFRDIYENLNGGINLLFVDELIDNGLDLSGVESALSVLKKMAYENKRNVYLISHREELIGRVSGILTVIKQNEFTSFEHNSQGNISQ